MAPRSVRWRSGRSLAPPVSSGRRCSSRSRIWADESAFTRAAASSRASGRSSRRLQISDTASSAWKPASIARALARKKPTPSSCTSGGTAYSCSPVTCSGSRLVTSTSRLGQEASSEATSPAASTTCSKLSKSKSMDLSAMCSARPFEEPTACDALSSTSAGSRSGARGTHQTPSGYPSDARPAACAARRVFPVPPGPVSVSRRVPSSRATTSASSRSRPRNGVVGTGRFVRKSDLSAGNSPPPS